MGLRLFRTCNQLQPSNTTQCSTVPNPDPCNFQIVGYYEHQEYLMVKVRYPDCFNYEGLKIILFKNISYSKLRTWKTLDPHFDPKNNIVARLAPTNEGWNMGLKIIHSTI
jgi:hypothetical protein